MRPNAPSAPVLLGFDLVHWTLLSVVVGAPAVALAAAISSVPTPYGAALVIPCVPALITAVLVEVALIRRLLPALEPGEHPFPASRMARVWLLAFMLRRVALHPFWTAVVIGSPTLRWLALTALGARVAFRGSMSSDVTILDPGLLEVGAGTTVGADCSLSGHAVVGDRLILGRITIGDGAQLHALCVVGPGTRIGPGAVVGVGCMMSEVEIGDDATLGVRCVLHPEVRIGAGARIGSHCILERGARVPAGAVVPSSTRIPKNTEYTTSP